MADVRESICGDCRADIFNRCIWVEKLGKISEFGEILKPPWTKALGKAVSVEGRWYPVFRVVACRDYDIAEVKQEVIADD
jgi:hypothetical protein